MFIVQGKSGHILILSEIRHQELSAADRTVGSTGCAKPPFRTWRSTFPVCFNLRQTSVTCGLLANVKVRIGLFSVTGKNV